MTTSVAWRSRSGVRFDLPATTYRPVQSSKQIEPDPMSVPLHGAGVAAGRLVRRDGQHHQQAELHDGQRCRVIELRLNERRLVDMRDQELGRMSWPAVRHDV